MSTTHFEWKEEYSVNVKLLDEQHKQLIKVVDDLYQSIMEKKEKDFISQIFDRLNDYATGHFFAEEKYFKEFGYQQAGEHIAQHEKFKVDLARMEDQEKEGKFDIFELLFYLENWWINHIIDMDKRYSQFFNEHGLV